MSVRHMINSSHHVICQHLDHFNANSNSNIKLYKQLLWPNFIKNARMHI